MSIVKPTKYSAEYVERTIRHFERMAREIKELKIENAILKRKLARHL